MNDLQPIVLASTSPRRAKILRALEIPFEVVRPYAEEDLDPDDPVETVTANARAKLKAALEEIPADRRILAADTIVWIDGRPIGKPRDLQEARDILRFLSGATHLVFTAVAFSDRDSCRVETSAVTFRELTDQEIEGYVARVCPTDRAGAYDIDENGIDLVDRYSGSFTNIMGLPQEVVLDWYRSGCVPPGAPRYRTRFRNPREP